MAAKRFGWLALAALSALLAVAGLVLAAWRVGKAIQDGSLGSVIGTAAFALLPLLFWRWILLGALDRARPLLDPETGEALAPAEEIGPWGWVGRGLLALLVIGFAAVAILGGADERRSERDTARLQQQVAVAAAQADLTVDRVADARVDWTAWLADDNHDSLTNPLRTLFTVPAAEIVDVSVDPPAGTAALLVRATDGPPCIVVGLSPEGRVSTRRTDRC